MENNSKKSSPLLDEYIQKQNQEQRFDNMEEEDIAKAIRTLLKSDDILPKDLN